MNETQPFLSICVPAWNSSAFIRKCISSVLAQTCDDWELLIVDDCSQDDTWSILQEYAGLPRVKVLRNERNLGQNENFNHCLRMTRGKWLMILAADDAIVPHTVETIRVELRPRPDAVLWVQNHLNRGLGRMPHLVTVDDCVREYGVTEFAELLYLKGNIFGEISNFVARRDALMRIEPPFREGSQTVDLRCWVRMMWASPDGRVVYWPEALTHILEHAASISSANNRTGETYLDFFRLPVDLLEVPWRRRVLFLQCLRMLKCALRFGGQLPAGKKLLPYQAAFTLCKRALFGPPKT
jgi:glycosyltransferase involved in cell wall biosynthesis